jgi:hypothetical protein
VSDLGEMLAWMPAMQQQASGCLEEALDSYSDLLGKVEGGQVGMRDETTAFVVAQASKAYAAVADWEGLEAFFARLEVNNLIHSGLYLGLLMSRYCFLLSSPFLVPRVTRNGGI